MNDEADVAQPIGIDKLPSGTHDPQIVLNTDPFETAELLQTIRSYIHNVYQLSFLGRVIRLKCLRCAGKVGYSQVGEAGLFQCTAESCTNTLAMNELLVRLSPYSYLEKLANG